MNATTVLVRRVKQGVAEWYRIQLKEKVWKGLAEHSMDGWNIGPAPYGYAADRTPHPNPVKAAQGRTKTRLVIDPATAPTVEAIFTSRTVGKLGLPAIAGRLNASPALYPAPAGSDGWAASSVDAILPQPQVHRVPGLRPSPHPGRQARQGRSRRLAVDPRPRSTLPSSTGPPGRMPSTSAGSTPPAATATRPRRRRTPRITCTGRGCDARPASGG